MDFDTRYLHITGRFNKGNWKDDDKKEETIK